jgi:sugar lactone lactonase YvrE
MSPDGRTMYAANWTGDDGGGSGISVLDVATGRVTGQIAADFSVTGLELMPGGRVLYLVNQVGDGSDQLVRLDLAAQRAGRVIAFPQGVQRMALAPDGSVLYVLEKASGDPSAIVPVDTGSGKEETPVPVPSWSQVLAVSPDGRTLYVGTGSSDGKGAGEVVPVDARSGKAGPPARFPYGVISIVVGPDGRELFGLASSYQCGAGGRSGCGGECDVVGLDLVTGKVQYATHVSSGCTQAKIGPGQRLFVLDGSKRLATVNDVTGQVESIVRTASVQNAGGATDLLVASGGRTVYVADVFHGIAVIPVGP